MTKAIFDADSRRTGLIGTVANIIGDEVTFASRTTRNPMICRRCLMKCATGAEALCHGSFLPGLDAGARLRLPFYFRHFYQSFHDHIGPTEHATMEDYLAAKLRLFAQCQYAMINCDIDCFSQVRGRLAALSYLWSNRPSRRTGEKHHENHTQSSERTSFDLQSP